MRTRLAVVALGAAHRDARQVGLLHLPDERVILRGEGAGLHAAEDVQVVLHLLEGVHAAEDGDHLGEVPHIAEGPFHRRPAAGVLGHHVPYLLGRVGDGAAAQRLHAHHGDAPLGREAHALQRGLVFIVQVVELNLRQLPVKIVHNLDEHILLIVEGEPGVADAPILQRPLQKAPIVQRLDAVEGVAAEGVHQIKIHIRHIQLAQLLIQQAVHVRVLLHQPLGQLGGQLYLFAVPVLEGQPGEDFALLKMVAVSSIHIVDTPVDGVAQHARGLRPVDAHLALFIGRGGQAHHAKAQPGYVKAQLAKGNVLHITSSVRYGRGIQPRASSSSRTGRCNRSSLR